MNLVNDLTHQELLIAQWLEHPTAIWEIIGSRSMIGDSYFFTLSHTSDKI